jgi:hypothetical protein
MARQILNIGDIRKVSNDTYTISGAYTGVDDGFDFKSLIGQDITIEGKLRNISTKVIDIKTFSSLANKQNVFILISAKVVRAINIGDSVSSK